MTTRRRRWAAGTVLAGSLVAMSATADVATAAPDAPTPYRAPAVHTTIQVTGAYGDLAPASTQPAVVDLLAGAPTGATLVLPSYAQGDSPMSLNSAPVWMAADNPIAPDVFEYPTPDQPGLTGIGIRPDLIQPSDQSSALCPGVTASAAGEISSAAWCNDWGRSGPQVHAIVLPYGVTVDGTTTTNYVYVDVVVEPTLNVTDPATAITNADVTVPAGSTTDVALTPPVAGATYEGFWLGASALDEVANWNPVPGTAAIGHGDYDSSLPARHLTAVQGPGATVTIGRDNGATGDHDLAVFGEWRMPDGSTAWNAENVLVTTPAYVAPVPISTPSAGPAPAPSSPEKAKPVLSCARVTPFIKTKKHGASAAVVRLRTEAGRVVPVSIGQLAKACGQPVWVSVTWVARGGGWHRLHAAGCGGVGHKRWLCAHNVQVAGHTPTRPKVKLFRGNLPSKVVKHHSKVQAIVTIKRAGTRKAGVVLATPWIKVTGAKGRR